MTSIDQVAEFHHLTNCPVLETPTIPKNRIALRINLLREELNELQAAAESGDLVGVADALTDLQYVLDGAYCEFGMKDIKIDLFNEVHRSNMTKFCTDGKVALRSAQFIIDGGNTELGPTPCSVVPVNGYWVILRESDGKVLKPLYYEKANLVPIVFPLPTR